MLLTWLEPVAIFLAALFLVLAVRHLLLRLARRRLASGRYGAIFLDMIQFPSVLWCLAAALATALRFASLDERQIHLAGVWIIVFLIVSFSLVAAAIMARMVAAYGEKGRLPFAVAGLSRTLTHIFVLSIGGMMLLHYLGINIAPLLTALGVGGLAVALALQDTLANFFAGVHILVENPITVGDFVRLASGEEGTVVDIGWRTTRMLAPNNSVIVIPNTKITSGILTNFNLPETETAVEAVIIAGLDADPSQLKTIALEEALQVTGVLRSSQPLFIFDPGPTPTHMQAKVIVHVGNRLSGGLIAAEIRMRIIERFRREGVPLPHPERLVVRRDGRA